MIAEQPEFVNVGRARMNPTSGRSGAESRSCAHKKICVLEDGQEYECWVSAGGEGEFSVELFCLGTGERYTYAVCPQFFIVSAAPLLWPVRSKKVLLIVPSPTCVFDGETPSVFSLCHPLDELKPVVKYADSAELASLMGDVTCQCEFVTQQAHGNLVGCCEFADSKGVSHVLAVMHNESHSHHVVYSFEKRRGKKSINTNGHVSAKNPVSDEITERLRGVPAAALAGIIPDSMIGPVNAPLYVEAPGSSTTWATSAFVVCAKGVFSLCLFKKERRVVEVVPVWPRAAAGAGSVKRIECDTAAYLVCNSPWKGTKLLVTGTKEGVLSVYYGSEKISEVNLHKPIESLETLCLSRSVREALVATTRNGEQRKDVVLTVKCLPSAELAAEVLHGLEECLPTKLVCEVLRGYNERLQQGHPEVLTVANDAGDWSLFSAALSSAMLAETPHNSISIEQSAWEALTASAYNYDARRDASLRSVWIGKGRTAPGSEEKWELRWERKAVQAAVNVMHLVYEDSKLSTLLGSARVQLARLLTKACSALGWVAHIDHYARDYPEELQMPGESGACEMTCADEPEPLSVYALLMGLLDGAPAEFPDLRAAKRLGRLVPLYAKVLNVPEDGFEDAAGALLERDWVSKDAIDEIPFGASLILREICVLCRAAPPATWPASAYNVIGRADLAAQKAYSAPGAALASELMLRLFQPTLSTLIPLPPRRRRHRNNNGSNQRRGYQPHMGGNNSDDEDDDGDNGSDDEKSGANNGGGKKVVTGAECDEQIVYMLFPSDKRVLAVQDMLQSSERVTVPIESPATEELLQEQQEALTRLYTRTLALPVGRGAFALSLDKFPREAAGVRFPAFMRDGRNLSGQDVTSESTPDEREERWPRFHNGVAVALRIAPGAAYTACFGDLESDSNGDGNGDNNNGNDATTTAGYIFGLWLQGHFSADLKAETLALLTRRHLLTKMAVLLGLSVANAGTMDEKAVKTLYLHAPFLRASPTAQVGISHKAAAAADATKSNPMLVATALLGTGLVYRGTNHRLPAEILLNELAVQPRVRNTRNPEAYALAAGLGLGLVGLGRGDSAELADLRLLDVLAGLITGGTERPEVAQLHDVERVAALNSLQPVCVLHNGLVNTPVTAPGAIAAIALLFLRTHNAVAARVLRAPTSTGDLAAQPPQILALRELARHLVCWGSIGKTQDWVEAQIPAFLRRAAEGEDEGSSTASLPSARAFCVGAQLAVTAGACMAMGYRYAGSADGVARRTLLGYLQHFVGIRDRLSAAAAAGSTTVGEKVLRAQVEGHIDNVALALAVVMAGTGDLECLRCLRALHHGSSGKGSLATYGDHLARHMALGFLFMGGGMLTFSTTQEATAALFCALYPIWPTSPGDNAYHLQIFRHLYVLAAESRLLVPCDIDTMRPCYLPVTVTDSALGTSFTRTAPFPLAEAIASRNPTAPISVSISSPRYLAAEFVASAGYGSDDVNEDTRLRLVRAGCSVRSAPLVMFVKRKAGFLPYADDPSGDKCINTDTAAPSAMTVPWNTAEGSTSRDDGRADLLQAFNNDRSMQAFMKFLSLGGTDRTSDFYHRAAVSCLSEEKGDLLPIVLALWHHAMHGRVSPEAASNVLLLKSARSCVLDPMLVSGADCCLREKFAAPAVRASIKRYILEGVVDTQDKETFAAGLHYLEVPPYGTVCKIRAVLKKHNPRSLGALVCTLGRRLKLSPSALANLISILKD